MGEKKLSPLFFLQLLLRDENVLPAGRSGDFAFLLEQGNEEALAALGYLPLMSRLERPLPLALCKRS